MTSPDQYATRLAQAGTLVGANRPQLANTLASSSLSNSEIDTVGGFVNAMSLSTTRRLASDSGAKTNFTDAENNTLSTIGEADPAKPADSRSFMEKALSGFASVWSNTGNFLLNNSVTHGVEDLGNALGNVAHWPFRLLSSAVDSGNDDEIDHEMKADGYDPTSTTSYLAFMFNQGENVYHDLGKARDTYGDDLVDHVIQFQRDPEQFQADLEKMDPTAAQKLVDLTNSKEWAAAAEAVDAQHISPGRDLARVITMGHTQNTAFKVLSGALDAAYDWYSDPTLILGKGVQLARAMDVTTGALKGEGAVSRLLPSHLAARGIDAFRGGAQRAGLHSMQDQAGVEKLLATDADGNAVTKVGKGWQSFVNDAKDLRAADAEAKTATTGEARAAAEAKRAGIYRVMSNRYGAMMPLLDEVNGMRVIADTEQGGRKVGALLTGTSTGGHVVEKGAPIETMADLTKYLTSTDGLLRLHTGMAAKQTVVMPGRLSVWAERKAAADTKLAKRTADKSRWIDYTNSGMLPNDAEQPLLDAAKAGDAQFKLLHQSIFTGAKAARAKADRISRRLTTLIPNVTHIDLTDARSAQQVEQFARVYLNKGDAARLASAYSLGDLGSRRQIVKGIIDQSFHASGLTRSEEGLRFREKFLGELDGERQQYGLGGESLINDGGRLREAALYPDQLSSKVLIPSMREMNYLATKMAVGGWARAFGQGANADKLMGTIKMGWITTAAGGLRNAADEIANFAVNGMGREVLAGRAAFTKATKELREQRRAYSREYLSMVKADGRDTVDDQLRSRVGEALVSHSDATQALQAAQDADAARAAITDGLASRVENGKARVATARDFHKRALTDYEQGKATGLTEAELAPLRDRMNATAAERVNAESSLQGHQKAAANPAKALADVEAKFAAKGVLSVDEAQTGLRAAERELTHARGLESAIRYRIPLMLRGAADNVNDVLIGSVLGKAMSIFGKEYAVTPERVKFAQELVDSELTQVLREGVFQSHFADTGAMIGSDDGAMAIHRAGLRARSYAYTRRYEGWGEVEPDGGTGLDAWAKTLQLRFADPTSPAHAWVQTVRAMGGANGLTPEILDAAKASVRARVDEEDLRHFVNNAEVFKQTKAGDKVAGKPALEAQAKDEYADRISGDLIHALTHKGEDGGPVIKQELLDSLADGVVPDRTWLAQNVTPAERPEKTIGQLWAPYNGQHEPGTFPTGYTAMMTKAYDKVVTDQINALSRNPLMTALYFNARKNTAGYEKALVDSGWSEDAAAEVAKRVSLSHAQDEAFKHIDNPYVASQASLIGRNYFAFVRAQEDWLRRWGRTIRDNPQLIRQAQLLVHGGTSTGMVEKDDQGNAMFVYPGSSVALGAFNKLFGIFDAPSGVKLPMNSELTSQLMLLNPSLDNPVSLSGTPLLSIPVKLLSQFLGSDHALLTSSLDQAINGQMGAGRKWYETMLPSWANRILSGVLSDDPGSKFGAAYTQALMHMEAAGQLDDAELQTPTGKARFQQALAAGVRNNLAFTALFGVFAPAAPSLDPTADGGRPDSGMLSNLLGLKGDGKSGTGDRADWTAHKTGLASLKDEARKVFSDLPYEQALAWWQKVHPGELIYGEGGARTTVGTPKASAPATIRAASWMEQNTDFVDKYGGNGGIAAYFIPQGAAGTKDGEYSDIAYRAQLEAGIRSYKSLDDYFNDIVTARGEAAYFQEKDKYDAAKESVGNSASAAQQLDDEWTAKKAELMAGNPLLAAKFAQYATDNAVTGAAVEQLRALVSDKSKTAVKALGANRAGVTALLSAYEQYNAGLAQIGDSRSRSAVKAKQLLKEGYQAQVKALAGDPNSTTADLSGAYPELADLARGVFRLPE